MIKHHAFISNYVFLGSEDAGEALSAVLDQCQNRKMENEREAKHKVGETVSVSDDLHALEILFSSPNYPPHMARELAKEVVSRKGLVIGVDKLYDRAGDLRICYDLEIVNNGNALIYIIPERLMSE